MRSGANNGETSGGGLNQHVDTGMHQTVETQDVDDYGNMDDCIDDPPSPNYLSTPVSEQAGPSQMLRGLLAPSIDEKGSEAEKAPTPRITMRLLS